MLKGTGIVSRRIVGVANKGLTPEVASTLGAILGSHLGTNSVVISARDFRSDSRMVKRAFASGLMSTGVDVLDLHAASLPVLQFALKRFGASAGVSFCGEHHRPEAIRLRIFDSTGIEIGPENISLLNEGVIDESKVNRVVSNDIGKMLATENTERIYRTALLNYIRKERIQAKKLKIVIDCALGTSSLLFPSILSDLGVKVVTLNAYAPTHVPESLPNPTSLKTIEKTVLATNADLGVGLDVEGGRLLLVDENGSLVVPDITAALYLTKRCEQPKGNTVVVTETTSDLIPTRIAEGCKVERVKAINPGAVSRGIRESRAFAGATDKGQLYFPSFTAESDAFLGVLWILELIATEEKQLSEIISPIAANSPAVAKEMPLEETQFETILHGLYSYCNSPKENRVFAIDTLCGVKVVFLEENAQKPTEALKGWVHVHPGKVNHAELTIEVKEEFSVNDIANQAIDLIKMIQQTRIP